MEELLVPKEEPQTNAEQSHAEVPGVETSTQAESSRDGWKHTREDEKLLEDVRENVGQPSSQRRQRRSPERYTRYMALVGECVATEPSSFEEAVQQPVWVDVMVEEYDLSCKTVCGMLSLDWGTSQWLLPDGFTR